jgi:hypothetical protein
MPMRGVMQTVYHSEIKENLNKGVAYLWTD